MFLYTCDSTKDGDVMTYDLGTNSIYSSSEARVLAQRQKQLAQIYGYDLDEKSLLFATTHGNQDAVLDQIGQQLGINQKPSDQNLSFDRYVNSSESEHNIMFQGEDGKVYNLNFTDGTYYEKSVEDFAEENGLINEEGKFYDIVDFGQDKAEFIDYAFQGAGDGKLDRTEVGLGNSTWGSINWVRQEVDQTTWGDGGSSGNSIISNIAFSNIVKHKDQWLNATDLAELEDSESYEEYLEKLAQKAVENMDETGNAEY